MMKNKLSGLAVAGLFACSNPAEEGPAPPVPTCTSSESEGPIDKSAPAALKMGLFDNCELLVGQARTIDVALLPDASLPAPTQASEALRNQALQWTSSAPDIAAVDAFGRVEAKAAGEATITVTSKTNPGVKAHAHLVVKTTPTLLPSAPPLLQGKRPVINPPTLQKLVDHYKAADVPVEGTAALTTGGMTVNENNVVWEIKTSATGAGSGYILRTDKNIPEPAPYSRAYFDKYQYFMGNRYLPIDATISSAGIVSGTVGSTTPAAPLKIASDGAGGIWVLASTNHVTHIRMEKMNPDAKAALMSDLTQLNVSRRGDASHGRRNAAATPMWQPDPSDNSGLWTSMYGAGELLRWATRKREGAPVAELARARATALKALKFNLLLANISGRDGTVHAKVRVLQGGRTTNGNMEGGNRLGYQTPGRCEVRRPTDADRCEAGGLGVSKFPSQIWALKAGCDYAVNVSPTGPAGLNPELWKVYDHQPLEPSCWTADLYPFGDNRSRPETETAARVRTLKGFIARTYSFAGAKIHNVPELLPGGTSYKRTALGDKSEVSKNKAVMWSQQDSTCDDTTSSGNTTYGPAHPVRTCTDYSLRESRSFTVGAIGEDGIRAVVDASLNIPAVLSCEQRDGFTPPPDCINMMQSDDGVVHTVDEIVYKADTSTDELVGHFFVYRVAYDVLSDSDPEEKAVKALIRTTMMNWSDHMIANNYGMVDGTGLPTRWGKTDRDYFNNVKAWEDSSLNSLVTLSGLKLTYYVTGEKRYQDEYLSQAVGPLYDYVTLAGEYWDRYKLTATPCTPGALTPSGLKMCNDGVSDLSDQKQVDEWILEYLNFSDQEMAALAYYNLLTLETDQAIRDKYVAGYESWWKGMRYDANPLFYLIRQLENVNTPMADAYGDDVVAAARWHLSRHPVDATTWGAYDTSRPDVVNKGIRPNKTGPILKANNGVPVGSAALPENHVAVPQDERALHKFNNPQSELGNSNGNPNNLEPSTTYTLPYWLGRYHNFIAQPQ